MDTWVLLATLGRTERRRRRWLYVLKSRGMGHSDEVGSSASTAHGLDSCRSRPIAHEEAHEIAEEGRSLELRLYVAGQTPKASRLREPRKICEEHLAGRYRIEVIDLLEEAPARPRRPDPRHAHPGPHGCPHPIKKIIGDLSNTERVLVGLDLVVKKETRKEHA